MSPHKPGVGESGVSQAYRRVKDKIRKDKKLERRISKIEKKDKSVKNEDLTPMSFPDHYVFSKKGNSNLRYALYQAALVASWS